MRARTAWLMAGLIATAPGHSRGEASAVRSGNDLLRDCKVAIETADRNVEWKTAEEMDKAIERVSYCLGFASGIDEGLRVGKRICSGDNEPAIQIARILVKFLEQNPDRLAEPQGVLAAQALATAWPCPEPGK